MSSNGEDDDTDDIEALRKAALATLKPKIQPIEQVISIGVSRTKVPEWSEVPASLDFPGFADPVPEPSPFPVSQHVPYTLSNFRQPLISSTWRSPFVNGTPAGRPRFPGFPSERRPYQHRPSHHRSFGDRGRPFYERGRRPPRGYIAGNRGGFHVNSSNSIRGSFTSNNPNRVIPLQETSSLPTPAPVHLNSSAVEPVPAGGNLIVIQPHKREGTDDSTSQKSQEESSNSQQINTISHHNASSLASSSSSKLDKPPSPKPKLQLPQDRYHSSQTSVQQVKKAVPEQPPKKPKDKFSRYDKSDSEEEDDWVDNRSEADDIADEIDKFLQDYDEDVVEEEKDLATECKLEAAPEEPDGGTGNGSGCSDEEVSGRSSPVPSEADSLDLDALASGDPVIGDFEDLDFLVDKEPVLENSSDIARLKASDADKNVVKENARVSDKSAEILRDTSPISSSSSSSPHSVNNPASPRRDEDGINSVNDRSDTKGADLSVQHSKNTDNRSHSPVLDRSSLREQGGKLKGSRSPINESHSIFRSRSPVHRRALSPRRLSPGRRRSVSPRRSPLRYRRSPLRGRSPRRSISPLRRNPHRTLSPKRIISPRRQNTSQQIFHQDRPISPHGRRHSPHGRSVSPYSANRHRNEVRSRRECDRSRNPGDNLRNRGRNRGSLSPSSRSRGGRWPDPKGRTITSPVRDERRGTGAQQAQSRESSSVGSRREDPSKGVFMDDKELEKLPPEERAKIEARRRKFGTREEVKVEDAMKTVSLKSIKERKKKPKKGEKTKEDPLNKLPDAPTKKTSEKSGISLKALRKKREQKQTEEEENSSEEEESSGHALVDLEDESEDSDTGRAWKAEGNKVKPVKLSIKSDSNVFRRGFDHVSSRFRTKLDRRRDEFRNRRPGNRERPTHRERIPSDRQKRSLSDDESDENIPSSRLGSSVVAPRVDVPPEKLRIQIQVAPKEKKKKKPKSKPDFTHVYSVPAKRRLSDDNGDDNDVEEEDDDDGEKIIMKKKSKKEKKERKEKKKKNVKDALGDTNDVLNADPVPKPRPSILERLGKKVESVESDTTEKKKKKKSKKSHLENGEGDDLDKHIQKMKLKNAAIERRQREIQLDKERYG